MSAIKERPAAKAIRLLRAQELSETGQYTRDEIAELLGVSTSTIHRYLRDSWGIHKEKMATKTANIQKMLGLMDAGDMSMPEIAELLGVSRATVYNYLYDAAESVVYTRKERNADSCRQARELYATGEYTIADIARTLNVNTNTAYYWVFLTKRGC